MFPNFSFEEAWVLLSKEQFLTDWTFRPDQQVAELRRLADWYERFAAVTRVEAVLRSIHYSEWFEQQRRPHE
jgi:hypothetical protein